jgi:hypothetical protein
LPPDRACVMNQIDVNKAKIALFKSRIREECHVALGGYDDGDWTFATSCILLYHMIGKTDRETLQSH